MEYPRVDEGLLQAVQALARWQLIERLMMIPAAAERRQLGGASRA
jgi:hypothetical protein